MRLSKIKAEQWMAFCEAGASIFAKCTRRQYFAVVLATNGRVVGTGYNGVPSGLTDCTDGGCPRASADVAHGSDYFNCLACHAEENAIVWSDRTAREGGTLIVNGPPCWDCAKLICGSGIKTVVHTTDLAYKDWPKCKDLMEQCGINVISLDFADSNEHTHSSHPLGCWGKSDPTVDMALGPRDGSPVAVRTHSQQDVWSPASLGSDDCCDD